MIQPESQTKITKIIKRDGEIVPFDKKKISFAVLRAAVAVGGRDKNIADQIADQVVGVLEKWHFKESFPTVEEVQDIVEKCLIENGFAKTAKAYIVYRYEHALKRAHKKSLTYSSENIPYKKLWEAQSWAVDKECITLEQITGYIQSGRIKDLIALSEDHYHDEVISAVNQFNDRHDDIKVIIVAGPSSSGKTTTCLKIKEELEKQGKRLVPLNVDNYFYNLEEHPQDTEGDFDFETPQALEIDLINKHLVMLLDGKEIQVPFYNFKKGKRDGILTSMKLSKDDIILIDSLHGMHDPMTASIPVQNKFKVYIETLSQLKDHNKEYVRWTDIRMLRRMTRDKQFRNYNPEQTILHWHYVRRSELRYIIARLREAHAVINSFLPYELPVLKARMKDYFPGFIEKLKDNPGKQDAYERAVRINALFSEITQWDDESVIPSSSLLREFIGNSSYRY